MKYIIPLCLLVLSLSFSCKKQNNDATNHYDTTYIDQSKIKQYTYKGTAFDSSYILYEANKDFKTVTSPQQVTLTYNYIDSTLSIWGVHKPLIYPLYSINDIPFGRDIIIEGDSFSIVQVYTLFDNSSSNARQHYYTFKGKKQ